MVGDVEKKDYVELINVWEQSVRATHHFLSEAHLQDIKIQILGVYFDAVVLSCIKNDDGAIIGFSGVSEQKLEMLFVLPSAQGQGVGSMLCRHAIENQAVSLVDVNEENPQALKFYEKMGFRIMARSNIDGEGRPYPILHLSMPNNANKKF